MGLVKLDEIDGAYVQGRVVCRAHITTEEWDELGESEFITNAQDDDEFLYFCERCGERLPNDVLGETADSDLAVRADTGLSLVRQEKTEAQLPKMDGHHPCFGQFDVNSAKCLDCVEGDDCEDHFVEARKEARRAAAPVRGAIIQLAGRRSSSDRAGSPQK